MRERQIAALFYASLMVAACGDAASTGDPAVGTQTQALTVSTGVSTVHLTVTPPDQPVSEEFDETVEFEIAVSAWEVAGSGALLPVWRGTLDPEGAFAIVNMSEGCEEKDDGLIHIPTAKHDATAWGPKDKNYPVEVYTLSVVCAKPGVHELSYEATLDWGSSKDVSISFTIDCGTAPAIEDPTPAPPEAPITVPDETSIFDDLTPCMENADCKDTASTFCKKEDGACDRGGYCTSHTNGGFAGVMRGLYNETPGEVCGCDGTTYPTRGDCVGAMVNIDHAGPCE